MTGTEMVEIVNIIPRRRWTTEEKLRIVAACEEPGKSVSQVARLYGVCPNLLYRWRSRIAQGGKVTVAADDEVVSKILEVKILKAAVRIGREKIHLICSLSGVEDFQ